MNLLESIGVGVLVFVVGAFAGGSLVQHQWDAAKAKAEVAAAEAAAAAQSVSAKEGAKQAEVQAKVQTVFRDRIVYRTKEVPVEVRVREDSECAVPERFVRMWNSANQGVVPDAAGQPDTGSDRAAQPVAAGRREAVGH